MRERTVEQYLTRLVHQAGGEVRKLKWIGRKGAPDRVVLLNGLHLVELKSPTGKLSPSQYREHERIARLGLTDIWVLSCFPDVENFIRFAIHTE